jgi:uncharacterized membrane protein
MSLLGAASVLIALLGLPMWLRMVPPNGWYGFRTPTTLSNRRVWYASNEASGRYLVTAGCVSLLVNVGASLLIRKPLADLISVSAFFGAIVVAVIASFVTLAHIKRGY